MISAQPTPEELERVKKITRTATPDQITWLVNRAAKGWGIAAFFNRTEHDVEIAVFGEGNWATRRFLSGCFHYVFNQLGCKRCTAMVAASNKKAFKMDIRLGFKLEGIVRSALGDQDVLLLGMLKSECRWLPAGNGNR